MVAYSKYEIWAFAIPMVHLLKNGVKYLKKQMINDWLWARFTYKAIQDLSNSKSVLNPDVMVDCIKYDTIIRNVIQFEVIFFKGKQ